MQELGSETMKKLLMAAGVATAMTATATLAQAELRIGFLTTLSGRGAIPGEELKRGWDLGLEHQGWTKNGDKLGGVETTIEVGDDKLNPQEGVKVVTKWLRQDNVHMVTGIIWSNVLMAIAPQVFQARKILLVQNAGAAPLHGRMCSRYFITTSWNNDQNSEATGQLMNDDGIKTVFAVAANYQAGKDNVTGMSRTFNGKVIGQALYELNTSDFQAEISRIREANPEAVWVFAPGGWSIPFMRQWAASGLGDKIRLYSTFTVDPLSLGAIGEAAVGTFHTNQYSWDLQNEPNKKFVDAFIAKHGRPPSMFAAQAYDAPALIASAVEATGGKVDNTMAMMRAMRKGQIKSVRSGGPIEYNVNGVPIQDWYKREVLMGANGPEVRVTGVVFANRKDSYWKECPRREWIR
jgi:branched-chain amino acid transport system substrate-binding protein